VSQLRWQTKPENRDYFGGGSSTERVRQWRLRHPHYWRKNRRRGTKEKADAQQDVFFPEPTGGQGVKSSLSQQEIMAAQVPLTVGLVSILAGSAQQEDIEASLRQLILKGQNILGLTPISPSTGKNYVAQTPDLSPTAAPTASAV
jgi:hypothetical protein